MHDARDDRRIEADAVQVLAAAGVPLDRRGLGGPALPDDRSDLALALRIHEDEAFAAEAVEILLHHAADQHRGDAGVEGVAAFQEHFERRGARQRMAGRDGAVRPGDGRAIGGPREQRRRTDDHERRGQRRSGNAKADAHDTGHDGREMIAQAAAAIPGTIR